MNRFCNQFGRRHVMARRPPAEMNPQGNAFGTRGGHLACVACLFSTAIAEQARPGAAAGSFPATEMEISVLDDFEDPSWNYNSEQSQKHQKDIDKRTNAAPMERQHGVGNERCETGHPDIVQRVPTPPRVPATRICLERASSLGYPGRSSNKMHQDDFICTFSIA